jgi:hypothetical protein
MCGIRCRLAGEARGELISGTYDGDRDSRGLEAQQPRLRTPGSSAEARRVDEDERDPPPGERSLNEPVDESRLETSGDHDELERPRRGTVLLEQEPRHRRVPSRLDRSE